MQNKHIFLILAVLLSTLSFFLVPVPWHAPPAQGGPPQAQSVYHNLVKCVVADLGSDKHAELPDDHNRNGKDVIVKYPGQTGEYSFYDCTNEKLPNGKDHHPVMRRFWCWQGHVKAGYEISGWLGQITPIHIHCWGERAINQVERTARPTYGPCGFSTELMKNAHVDEKGAFIKFEKQTDLAVMEDKIVKTSITSLVDTSYYEYTALLAAVSRARGSFVMIELGAGWGRWLMHAFHANKQAKNLPTVLIGVEADPLHYQFMRQNFVANGAKTDANVLLFGGVSAVSAEERVTRMNPASSYGAALVDDKRYGFTTVPTTSLNDLLSGFWIVDHIDFDIQGLEVDIINASRDEMNLRVRSIWVECHTAEVYFKIVDILYEMKWSFIFNLPPAELERTVDYGQGPVQLEKFHGGVGALNPRIE